MRSLSKWFTDERRKLAGYDWAFRLEYIWIYYKLWVVGLTALLTFLIFFFYTWFAVPSETLFHAVFSNTYAPLGEGSAFYREYVDYAGLNLREGNVVFNAENYCKPSTGRVQGNSYYEYLIAMLDGKSLDVWIAQQEEVLSIGAGGRLMDLRDERMAEVMAAYGDRLVWCQPLEGEELVPVGIDLSGSRLTGEFSAYPDGAVLGVNAYGTRLDRIKKFLDFLFIIP